MTKKTFKAKAQNDIKTKADVQKKTLNTDAIKSNIKILPELEKLIPPLTNEEFFQLEENILAEGCRDALVLWQRENEYILIDGHNRYAICTKHKRDFKTSIMNFKDMSEVKDWMVSNQLGKRNITEETKSYLRGMRYNQEKGKRGGDKKSKGQSDRLINTSDSLADTYKVSEKTIRRDAQYTDAIDKLTGKDNELKWKILNKDIQVPKNKVIEIVDKGTEEIKKAKKLIKETGSLKPPTKPKDSPKKEASKSDQLIKEINQDLKKVAQSKDQAAFEEIKKKMDNLQKLIFPQ